MDIPSHALTSYVLARGFFPRRPWPVVVGMVLAGVMADGDVLSAVFGPGAYFAARRTYTHSLLGTLAVIALAALVVRALGGKQPETWPRLLLPLALAAVMHVVLDVLQSEGVAVLWPWREKRFAMDWLPTIDPWILLLLLGGILVPELFRLVTSEIGAKSKAPRGRNGAIVALVLMVLYVGGRAMLHESSNGLLEPHAYHGESARRVASYPDAFSLFTWHGVIETESLLCEAEVPVGPGRSFDPEHVECVHKPEASPELDAAQKTRVVREFMRAEPFPRAMVVKTQEGYEVVVRSLRDLAQGESYHRIAARVLVDGDFKVESEEFAWSTDIHLR